MKKNIVKAAVLSACFAAAGAAQAFVGTIAVALGEMNEEVGRIQTPFAADATLETEQMTANTRVFYQPGMVRDEINMGAQQMTTIRRFDLNKVWTLMGQGMYMEVDPDQGSDQAPDYKLVSREIVGREVVNGMETTKYKSVYQGKDGKFGGFTWYTDDNIAVKAFIISESKGDKERIKFEFTNLQRGPQDDALFELPAGAQPMTIPGMGGMPDMRQMQQQYGGMTPQQMEALGSMQQQGQPYGTMPQQNQQYGSIPQQPANEQEDGGFVEDVVEQSTDEAKESTKDGISKGIGDGIKKGLGKLFGG
jgi:hypothetical protein